MIYSKCVICVVFYSTELDVYLFKDNIFIDVSTRSGRYQCCVGQHCIFCCEDWGSSVFRNVCNIFSANLASSWRWRHFLVTSKKTSNIAFISFCMYNEMCWLGFGRQRQYNRTSETNMSVATSMLSGILWNMNFQ